MSSGIRTTHLSNCLCPNLSNLFCHSCQCPSSRAWLCEPPKCDHQNPRRALLHALRCGSDRGTQEEGDRWGAHGDQLQPRGPPSEANVFLGVGVEGDENEPGPWWAGVYWLVMLRWGWARGVFDGSEGTSARVLECIVRFRGSLRACGATTWWGDVRVQRAILFTDDTLLPWLMFKTLLKWVPQHG